MNKIFFTFAAVLSTVSVSAQSGQKDNQLLKKVERAQRPFGKHDKNWRSFYVLNLMAYNDSLCAPLYHLRDTTMLINIYSTHSGVFYCIVVNDRDTAECKTQYNDGHFKFVKSKQPYFNQAFYDKLYHWQPDEFIDDYNNMHAYDIYATRIIRKGSGYQMKCMKIKSRIEYGFGWEDYKY